MFQFNRLKNGEFSPLKRALKIGGIFLILLVLLWGAIVFFFVPRPFDTLSGTLYLTLASQGDTATDLYQFDIKTRQFTKTFDDTFIKFTGKLSPDGKKLAFFSAPLDRTSDLYLPTKEPLQLKVYDKMTGNITKLTDTPLTANRIGGWSPDGSRIVFTSQPVDSTKVRISEEDFFESDKWSVDTVDMNMHVEHIDAGTNPLWAPDGTGILYLKNDGIYLYTFAKMSSEKVYDIRNREAKMNMKLKFSPDGKYLAWSSPDDRRLILFQVNSLDAFSLTLAEQIFTGDSFVSWPVFSSDGRYLAFQRVDVSSSDGTLKDPRLTVYDIVTKKYLKLADLNQYNFNFTFIDDWR